MLGMHGTSCPRKGRGSAQIAAWHDSGDAYHRQICQQPDGAKQTQYKFVCPLENEQRLLDKPVLANQRGQQDMDERLWWSQQRLLPARGLRALSVWLRRQS